MSSEALNGSYVLISAAQNMKNLPEPLQIRNDLPDLLARSDNSANSYDPSTALPLTISRSSTTQTNVVIVTAATSTPQGTSTSFPSSLPKVIAPINGIPQQPKGTTMMSLGFRFDLNYAFVVSNPSSIEQIFRLIGSPVAAALNISESRIVVLSLQPRNTIAINGFITTLAMMYIPTYTVSTLRLLLLDPNSRFFQNPDPAI